MAKIDKMVVRGAGTGMMIGGGIGGASALLDVVEDPTNVMAWIALGVTSGAIVLGQHMVGKTYQDSAKEFVKKRETE